MKKITAFLVFAMVAGLAPVWALDAPIDEGLAKLADHDSYTVKAPGMLIHGLYEIGEAPLEPLHRPFEATFEKKDYVFGLFKGINQGTYNMLEGLTRGIFNVCRALVPGIGRYENKEEQKKILPVLGA